MIVLPSGRILFADGMYGADYFNSDNFILADMWKKDNGLASFVKPDDHLVGDKGFQNIVKDFRKNLKVKTHNQVLLMKVKSRDVA